jgi:hypothetical protein
VPQNPLNQEESKVNPQEHLLKNSTENHQIKAISEGLLEQTHQAKRHIVLICDIQQESHKETSSKLHHEFPKKRLRKSPKRENGGDNKRP